MIGRGGRRPRFLSCDGRYGTRVYSSGPGRRRRAEGLGARSAGKDPMVGRNFCMFDEGGYVRLFFIFLRGSSDLATRSFVIMVLASIIHKTYERVICILFTSSYCVCYASMHTLCIVWCMVGERYA